MFSDDIVNGEVRTQDISDTNGVSSADVRDDSLKDGGLGAADLRPDSVGTSEVAADAVGTDEIIDGSLGTSELSSAIPAARVTNSADESTRDRIGESLPFDSERYDTADMHTADEQLHGSRRR